MKLECLLVSLFIFTGTVIGQETTDNTAILKSKFVKAAKICSALHRTSLVQAIALFSERETNDHEGKCFLFCMLRQYQLMDKHGNYKMSKFEPLLSMIPISQFLTSIKTNLQECLQEDATDPCEKSYKFLRCFYKNGMTKPNIDEAEDDKEDDD